jgi:hypothetical protein
MNNEHDDWVVPPHYGWWIVRMGCLIPVSVIHAYTQGHHGLAVVSAIACATTLLYWSKPTRGVRRALDIVVIQLCLLGHLAHAWRSDVWWDYVAITGMAASTYPAGYALQVAGCLGPAMACHVILHGLVFTANNYLYWFS